jgi:hypothetical protein
VAKPTTPHTQTQQNVTPMQSDLDSSADNLELSIEDLDLYENMDGAETGTNRTPKKIPDPPNQHKVEPQPVAYEGDITSRAPGGEGQGITSHSSDEERERQEKVVKDRPDAQAGLNHSK